MSVAIASVIAVLVAVGAGTMLVLSGRLRDEIAELLGTFDRAERHLTPLVATVRTDRERLAARLEQLTDPESDATRR